MPFNIDDSVNPNNAPATIIGQINGLANQVRKIIGADSWKIPPASLQNINRTKKQSFTPLGGTLEIDLSQGTTIKIDTSLAISNVNLNFSPLATGEALKVSLIIKNGLQPISIIFPENTLQPDIGGNIYTPLYPFSKDIIAFYYNGDDNNFLDISRKFLAPFSQNTNFYPINGLLLDLYPQLNPALAISTRLLRADLYNEWLFQIRRDDNEIVLVKPDLSLPIPAISNNSPLKGSNFTLKDFLGAREGFVISGRNQSKNGIGNVTQADPNKQPKIFENGNLIIKNGIPALLFDGIKNALVVDSNCNIDINTGFTFICNTYINLNSKGSIVKVGDYSGGIGMGVGGTTFDNGGNNPIALNENSAWLQFPSLNGLAIERKSIAVRLITNNDVTYWVNNSKQSYGIGGFLNPSQITQIGGYSGRNFDGYLSEVLIFNDQLSDVNVQQIINNQLGLT